MIKLMRAMNEDEWPAACYQLFYVHRIRTICHVLPPFKRQRVHCPHTPDLKLRKDNYK
jgi:hypothetical protein